MAVAVAAGVGVTVSAASRMRSISWSPALHGCVATDQVSVPATASTVAVFAERVRATDPSRAMKSSAWPVSDA